MQPAVETPQSSSGLHLTLQRRQHLVELRLAGDLDLSNANLLTRAMGWLRRRTSGMIVIDSRDLVFVDLAGYRALNRALDSPDGRRDPRVLHVIGTVVTKLEGYLATAVGATQRDAASA